MEDYSDKNIRNQNLQSKDVIIENDAKWSEKIKNYKSEKNAYNFNLSHYPGHVTHKFQKEQENSFNPITQKYADKFKENSIKEYDKKTKIDDISKGYDYELNLESTYNVINLKNKLKGLNYSEDKYLKNKLPKNNLITNKYFYKPYNIISNNSFKVQHYLPPELRGTLPSPETSNEGIMPIKKKKNYYNDKYIKDFDIINNRYKFFHKEKEATEREIQTLEAAKKIQNLRTYDIIKRKFINPEIEENFIKSNELKQNLKINNALKDKTKNKNYVICNPINNEVLDKEAQNKLDQNDSGKLEKFRIRNKAETLYRNMDINHEIKIDNKFKNIGKELENKIINDRGYDIINHTIFNEDNRVNRHKKFRIISDWEKLKSLSDEKNSTFNKKTIYKSMYDKSDVNENYRNYLIKRRLKLKELMPLNEDNVFKISVENNKMRNIDSNSDYFTKTFNYTNKSNNVRNNTVENERRRNFIIYKFNNTNNLFNKKNFYENKRNILDYDNKDSRPILVDKNVNTRYFKKYLARFGKK
jgi:hypothetical protein